jgi:hypothetical protein
MSSKATLRKMNRSLYAAAFHLLEAGKHLSNVEGFRPASQELFERAKFLADIIQIDSEKISEERVNSILDEILNFNEQEATQQ